jgi:hypothetical protein
VQCQTLNGTYLLAPLTKEDASLLRLLSLDARNGNRHAPAIQLGAYEFPLITSPHAPPELKALVQQLRQTPWPAFIADGLWFIHAVNGAMLNLFGIAPDSPLLRRWESWHLIATQFTDPSPVRDAHVSPDNCFPSAICAFFRATLRYLFTPQMRALLRSLHQISLTNQTHFSTWWYQTSAFSLAFELKQDARILRRSDRYFLTSIRRTKSQFVPITAKMQVPFFLGIWQPLAAETQAAFARLSGAAAASELFFAADHDTQQANHVNSWPETKAALSLTR